MPRWSWRTSLLDPRSVGQRPCRGDVTRLPQAPVEQRARVGRRRRGCRNAWRCRRRGHGQVHWVVATSFGCRRPRAAGLVSPVGSSNAGGVRWWSALGRAVVALGLLAGCAGGGQPDQSMTASSSGAHSTATYTPAPTSPRTTANTGSATPSPSRPERGPRRLGSRLRRDHLAVPAGAATGRCRCADKPCRDPTVALRAVDHRASGTHRAFGHPGTAR